MEDCRAAEGGIGGAGGEGGRGGAGGEAGAGGDEPPCADADDDGYCAGVDCDDRNAQAHPGATEVPGNGTDDDCVGGDEPLPQPEPVECARLFTRMPNWRIQYSMGPEDPTGFPVGSWLDHGVTWDLCVPFGSAVIMAVQNENPDLGEPDWSPESRARDANGNWCAQFVGNDEWAFEEGFGPLDEPDCTIECGPAGSPVWYCPAL